MRGNNDHVGKDKDKDGDMEIRSGNGPNTEERAFNERASDGARAPVVALISALCHAPPQAHFC